jgi:DNA-binding NtrC family response regulator
LLQHFSKIHGKGRVLSFEPGALSALVAFEWPGNVRQLENEVRRLLVLCDERVPLSQLSPELQAAAPGGERLDTLHVRVRVDALERELVEAALDQTGGNQTRAAELLGLSRFGLQKMMKRLDIGGGPRDVGRRRSGRRSAGELDEPR